MFAQSRSARYKDTIINLGIDPSYQHGTPVMWAGAYRRLFCLGLLGLSSLELIHAESLVFLLFWNYKPDLTLKFKASPTQVLSFPEDNKGKAKRA